MDAKERREILMKLLDLRFVIDYLVNEFNEGYKNFQDNGNLDQFIDLFNTEISHVVDAKIDQSYGVLSSTVADIDTNLLPDIKQHKACVDYYVKLAFNATNKATDEDLEHALERLDNNEKGLIKLTLQ